MTLAAETATSRPGRRLAHASEAAARGLVYCAALLPLAITAAALALSGRASNASRWWGVLQRRVLATHSAATPPPTATTMLWHAALSLPLGLAALIPLSMEALFLLRSVLYGLVDRGPYTDSWGGPTLIGAWAAHLLVGLPLAAAALLALWGIARLHERLTLACFGERSSRWPMLATFAIALSAGLLFAAWLRQLPS